MLRIRTNIRFLVAGLLSVPLGVWAETYTISSMTPTSSSINLDIDGAFGVYIPANLWSGSQCCGPITRRYGTLRERRILPNGTVLEYSHSVVADAVRSYSGRLSGTTEFYELKHCAEYLGDPANFQCSTSPVHLTIQSFSPPNQMTSTTSAPPPIDLDGGHVNCVGPQC